MQEPRPREEWLTLPVTSLVDEATWEQAQHQLDRNKRNASRNTKREYLLRGLIFFLPAAGAGMPATKQISGAHTTAARARRRNCGHLEDCDIRFSIEQGRLESAVLGAIKSFLLDPETRAAGISAEKSGSRMSGNGWAMTLPPSTAISPPSTLSSGDFSDDAIAAEFPEAVLGTRKRDLLAEREHRVRERERAWRGWQRLMFLILRQRSPPWHRPSGRSLWRRRSYGNC